MAAAFAMALVNLKKMNHLNDLKQKERLRIITELYENKRIGRLIKRAASGKDESFEDELRSELFLQICEMPAERLIKMDSLGETMPYIEAIIKMQKDCRGGKVNINRQIDYVPNRANNDVPLSDGMGYLMDFIKDEYADINIDVEAAMDKLDWFEKRVVELYVEYGTIKDIVEHTGTDDKYVVKVMNAARKKIKNALR